MEYHLKNIDFSVFPAGKPFLVLLHAFVLAAIPADGPCKISITSPKSREIPEQTDTEIEYLTNTAISNKLRFKIGSVTKSLSYKLINNNFVIKFD